MKTNKTSFFFCQIESITVCGEEPEADLIVGRRFASSGNVLEVKFKSNHAVTAKGFRAKYWQAPIDDGKSFVNINSM